MTKPIDLDVKRFHMPGISFWKDCPICSARCTVDMSKDYLSFPTANVEFEYPMVCLICKHTWKITLRLSLHLEIVHKHQPGDFSFFPHDGVEEDLT